MRRSSTGAVARKFFFPDVKAVWYAPNVAADVLSLFSLWTENPGNRKSPKARLTFGALKEGDIHAELWADVERYVRRLKRSKKLPAILIDIRPSGQRVVWDGNRRCAAYVRAGCPPGVTIPAYFIERRKKARRDGA